MDIKIRKASPLQIKTSMHGDRCLREGFFNPPIKRA